MKGDHCCWTELGCDDTAIATQKYQRKDDETGLREETGLRWQWGAEQ